MAESYITIGWPNNHIAVFKKAKINIYLLDGEVTFYVINMVLRVGDKFQFYALGVRKLRQ